MLALSPRGETALATVGLASDPADPAALAGCISQPGPWRMGPRLPPGGQGQTKGSLQVASVHEGVASAGVCVQLGS